MKKVLPAFLVVWLVSAGSAVAAPVINEFVVNATPEWVEFYNPEDSTDTLKTYWLDDDVDFGSDSGSSAKKLLTNLNSDNVHYPYIEITSVFNNSGDFVVLFDNLGNIVDQHQFTSDPGSGVSIGRDPDQSGLFGKMNVSSKGGPNPSSVTPTTVPPTPTVAPTGEPTPTEIPPIPTPEPTEIPIPTPTETIEPTPTEIPEPTPTVAPTPTTIVPTPTEMVPTVTPTPTLETTPASTHENHEWKHWVCEKKVIRVRWGRKVKEIVVPICHWQWRWWNFRFSPLHKHP